MCYVPSETTAWVVQAVVFRQLLSFNRVKKGSGVINTLINKLPFELHIPGYQYCGPGIKLAKRLARGDPGINKLDQSCREHDIAYNQSSNIEDRHKADYRLEQQAWERVKSKDVSLGEKSAAWAITNTMKVKRKLGMGLNKKPKGRALSALGGGAAGIAKAVNDGKASHQQLAEQQRHNLAMEKAATGKGLRFRRNKKGKGFYLEPYKLVYVPSEATVRRLSQKEHNTSTKANVTSAKITL
ncbi:hypothetical protein NQ315_006796 [Exocentrus adspersus]|uniref:Phospholipase A2-like domain-containing protein n=1 Tax=Exocentrus adspersus TaxID=1586481 RepID=A0AAV8WBU8_9CUCU|nr:hypothetical protein NQ315_006796 [Exocentrus adspersus]